MLLPPDVTAARDPHLSTVTNSGDPIDNIRFNQTVSPGSQVCNRTCVIIASVFPTVCALAVLGLMVYQLYWKKGRKAEVPKGIGSSNSNNKKQRDKGEKKRQLYGEQEDVEAGEAGLRRESDGDVGRGVEAPLPVYKREEGKLPAYDEERRCMSGGRDSAEEEERRDEVRELVGVVR